MHGFEDWLPIEHCSLWRDGVRLELELATSEIRIAFQLDNETWVQISKDKTRSINMFCLLDTKAVMAEMAI